MVKTQKFDLDTDTTLGGDNASDYIAPSQKAIKDYVDNHSSGGSTEIFICTPNVTTYAEITTALNADKMPVIIASNKIYIYTQYSGSGFYNFNYVDGNAVHYYNIDTSNNWTSFTWTNEATSNKVTSLTQYSSNTQYPSAKCVYDALATKVTSVNNIQPVNGNVTLNIPSEVTESTVSGWGFTKNTGTVTSVNNTSPDANGNVTLPSEVFIAEYGITSYADVLAAYNARKTIFCKYLTSGTSNSINYFSLNQKSINGVGVFVFSRALDNYISKCSLNELNGWSAITDYRLELASNKVTSISSSSTDTQYPSAKCMYDIVKDQNNTSNILKFWTGTKAQYDAISTKDSNTLYNITDDQDVTLTLLQTIYPVGSVYLSTNATCPLASLFGTWTLVSSGKALWTGTGSNGGSTINAGLPNITGSAWSPRLGYHDTDDASRVTGAFSTSNSNGTASTSAGSGYNGIKISFNASQSNSIYGNSTTVQPPAYVVNVWRRTA